MRGRGYSKYGAVKTVVDGVTFASKAEARRYGELKLLASTKEITDLRLQPKFDLVAGVRYIADFSYYQGPKKNEHLVVEDVKGMETRVFKLKLKLFRHFYPHIDLRIVK